MKNAAYSNIPNLYNYDLSSSQVAISLYEMEKCGIDSPWLKDYISDKTKRSEYASHIGISEGAWKQCLIATLMGAYLPNHAKGKSVAILDILQDELEERGESINGTILSEKLKLLRNELKPLMKPLGCWHQRIIEDVKASGRLINKVGLEVAGTSRKSQLIAHYLQGIEACFIHTLTLLAEKYDFKPIGNEHDGLITLGPIPQEAIEEAKRITGLYCLELREKPFL
jgi:hypothetical protein